MERELLIQEWYELLVDDCGAIISESVYIARQRLIEGRHELGQRIIQDIPNFNRSNIYGQKIVQSLAESLKIGTRTLYNAMRFVNKYPDLEAFMSTVEEGKNISWNKVVTRYLPEEGEKAEREKIEKTILVVCPGCGHRWDMKI